jgi:hypothetical protein
MVLAYITNVVCKFAFHQWNEPSSTMVLDIQYVHKQSGLVTLLKWRYCLSFCQTYNTFILSVQKSTIEDCNVN